MILNDYNSIIRENFNISDTQTRKTIIALEDAEQSQLLGALSSALYDKIINKVDKIDFGTIPRSRGDITKVDGFENTMECLKIMRALVMEYKENPACVDTVLGAIENIRSRKALFMKAYALNVELPMVLYNLTVSSIEQTVSFLISVCIQYIKDPATNSMSAALDKVAYNNARENLLYEQLVAFNNSCNTKELDQVLNNVIKNGSKVHESTIIINVGKDNEVDVKTEPEECSKEPVGSLFKDEEPETETPVQVPVNGDCVPNACELPSNGISAYEEPVEEAILTTATLAAVGKAMGIGLGATVLGAGAISLGMKGISYLLKALIPLMRNMVYTLYNTQTKISDCLAMQAHFIEANAYKLQYSTNSDMTDEKRVKVVSKQLKWAEKLKEFSNKIAIDHKKAEREAQKMAKEDVSKKSIKDLNGYLPADFAGSGLF